jgi:flagellar biosynthesis protein FlhG
MREILKEVSQNLFLIPGGNGIVEFNHLNFFERRAIIEGISALPGRFDYLLIDTAPGISENVLFLNSSVQTVSVVITPDPSSFADAYALIKVLTTKHKVQRFSIICNMVRDHEEGHALFKKFSEVVTKFLFVGLEYWGGIPMDAALRKANQSQRLILKHEPMAESASAIRKISDQVDLTSRHINSSGGMQMFWDQVVGSA